MYQLNDISKMLEKMKCKYNCVTCKEIPNKKKSL